MRAFGVFLVIGSLFTISIFAEQITGALTVNAIQDNVGSLSDIDGRSISTIEGSTTSDFGTDHFNYAGLDELSVAFETSETEAVVFNGSILVVSQQIDAAYFVNLSAGV